MPRSSRPSTHRGVAGPEGIAAFVAIVLSDDARFVAGATLPVVRAIAD